MIRHELNQTLGKDEMRVNVTHKSEDISPCLPMIGILIVKRTILQIYAGAFCY